VEVTGSPYVLHWEQSMAKRLPDGWFEENLSSVPQPEQEAVYVLPRVVTIMRVGSLVSMNWVGWGGYHRLLEWLGLV